MQEKKVFTLIISEIDKAIFSGDVESVTVPADEGVMTILAHHTPIISRLKGGDVHIRISESEKKTISIRKGVVEVSSNIVTILV